MCVYKLMTNDNLKTKKTETNTTVYNVNQDALLLNAYCLLSSSLKSTRRSVKHTVEHLCAAKLLKEIFRTFEGIVTSH